MSVYLKLSKLNFDFGHIRAKYTCICDKWCIWFYVYLFKLFGNTLMTLKSYNNVLESPIDHMSCGQSLQTCGTIVWRFSDNMLTN
jgi:hypothetical protein